MKTPLILLTASILLTLPPAYAVSKAVPSKKPASSPSVRKHPTTARSNIITNFTFRGNRIGDPAEAVIRRSIKNTKEESETTSEPSIELPSDDWLGESEPRLNEQDTCIKHLKMGKSDCTDYEPDFLPYYDTFLTYEFFDKKFSGFDLTFHLNAHSQLKTMLIGKYGKPHQSYVKKVHNAMGASFDQIVSVWNTKHGPMTLYSRYSSIDKGALILQDARFKRLATAREAQALQRKGKKVF